MTVAEEKNLIYSTIKNISEEQKAQIEALWDLYMDWNSKINVISRKDIDHLYLHHVLHSLGILKMIHFAPNTKVIDVGTGGGFPAIPLAILFPKVQFLLVDSIGKKLKVAQSVADSIGLKNVETIHSRIENIKASCHFIITRGTMPFPDLVKLSKHLINKDNFNVLPNGFIALKGGNLDSEISKFKNKLLKEDLYPFLNHSFFEEKKIIYLPI